MRIEGIVATSNLAIQQPMSTDGAMVRDRAQVAAVPGEALTSAKQGENQASAVGAQLLSSAVDQVGNLLNTFTESMEFKIHKDTNTTMVQVVDKDSGEIVRQYPAEKFLDLVALFQKQLSGLFVDVSR